MKIQVLKKQIVPIILAILILLMGCSPMKKPAHVQTGILPAEYFNPQGYLSGYIKAIAGDSIHYHSPIPEVTTALICRATDGHSFVEWQTEVWPAQVPGDSVTFIWLSGLGCNLGEKEFTLFVNGEQWIRFRSVRNKNWRVFGKDGCSLKFQAVMEDQHKDLFGYMYFTLPAVRLRANKPLKIKVVGEKAGSNAWFMVFCKSLQPELSCQSQPALVHSKDTPLQPIRCSLFHLGDSCMVELRTHQESRQISLNFGLNLFELYFPGVTKNTRRVIKLLYESQEVLNLSVLQIPVRKMDIYLLPHTHLDIGYTHKQEDVLRLQWRHLNDAITICEESQRLSPDAHFRWNPEQLWPVLEYLRKQPIEERKKLLDAIQRGWIGLDAFYGNMLTGLCRPEELFEAVGARELLREGIRVESAMITDVPGWSWGIVPVLAQSGIRYLSLGPNLGHRLGNIYYWADSPFYWQSPSGKEKVLCWLHGKGYSWFHTGLTYHLDGTLRHDLLTEDRIFPYLQELYEKNYPYDLLPIRYSIGADNGPPDPTLPEQVENWNKRYVTPHLKIATTSEFFRHFEKKYHNAIPTVRGDITPYWEDGAASTARETALARNAADRLLQAELLWSLFRPGQFPYNRFQEAWENILLFNEHTWGAWNSISQPDDAFVKQQWHWKKQRALDADSLSRSLLSAIVDNKKPSGQVIEVINTCSWPRSGIVQVPANWIPKGRALYDEHNKIVLQQRLSSGKVIFWIEDVPALGGKRLRFGAGDRQSRSNAIINLPANITNSWAQIQLDPQSGAITSLKAFGQEWVDDSRFRGLNHYLYVAGRDPANVMEVSGPVRFQLIDDGPVVSVIEMTSSAPGCNSITRRLTLYHKEPRIDLVNELNRPPVREPEGIHIAFPFLIPGGRVRIQSAWAVVQPNKDQLPGACKNWFSVQYWADVSNEEGGVTIVPLDAPLLELAEIQADPIVCGWTKKLPESQTLLSYIMNNYWETNYKADQPGITRFRYSLLFHRQFDQAAVHRQALAVTAPLLGSVEALTQERTALPIIVESDNVVVTRVIPIAGTNRLLVRLFNPAEKQGKVHLRWQKGKGGTINFASPFGDLLQPAEEELNLPPYGICSLVIRETFPENF